MDGVCVCGEVGVGGVGECSASSSHFLPTPFVLQPLQTQSQHRLHNAPRALDRNPFIVEIIGKLSRNSHPFWAFYYVFPAYRRQILQLQGEEMREIGH